MPSEQQYRGRFAPSPTGPLHFGSLVTALASYVDAKQHQGKWLVRIDDLDQGRCVPGMDAQILRTLEAFGLRWDQTPVYQTQHAMAYETALQKLSQDAQVYFCECSRRQVQQSAREGSDGPIYPGTCRSKGLSGGSGMAVRVRTNDQPICLRDRSGRMLEQRLESEIGDFVVRRADGFFAYQLAVVVDDQLDEVTHVVRGADLMSSTPRQIYLQQLLDVTTPTYLHVPLVLDAQRRKLSKSSAAHPVDAKTPLPGLLRAWDFLSQLPPEKSEKPASVAEFMHWAIAHWQISRLNPLQENFA